MPPPYNNVEQKYVNAISSMMLGAVERDELTYLHARAIVQALLDTMTLAHEENRKESLRNRGFKFGKDN